VRTTDYNLNLDDGDNSSPVSPLVVMSQNDDDIPSNMNMLALQSENEKKTSSYNIYQGKTGASATDMFQVSGWFLNSEFT
jgi:hypothetical protein